MGMGFAPTWLRQVSPPASHDHFNHWDQAAFAEVRCLGGASISFLCRLAFGKQT